MLRILVICTGNTCRSPMAEALLKDKVRQAGLGQHITIVSAGLMAGGAFPVSAGAAAAMERMGIPLLAHQSRQLLQQDIEDSDLIFTMTGQHKRAILAAVPGAGKKVFTLSEFAGATEDVADPYGGDDAVYWRSAQQIARLLDTAWEKIVLMAGKNGSTAKNDE